MPTAESVNPSPVSALLFALPRLATAFAGTAIVTLTLPQMVVAAVGDARKGLHLGSITLAASLASLAALYASGRFSDRRRQTTGRRRLPAVWLALMVAPLAVLAVGVRYPVAVAAILALVVTRSLCDAAHLPIIADDFRGLPGGPRHALRTRLSAHIAFDHFVGSGLGAAAFAGLPDVATGSLRVAAAPVAIVLAVASAAGFLRSYRTDRVLPDPAGAAPGPAGAGDPVEPWFSPCLRDLLTARTLFMAGVLIVSTFLVFLVRDVLAAADVEQVTAMLFGGAIAGALLTALPAGRLAARVGDRPMLMAAGLVIAVVAPAFLVLAPQRPAVAMTCMVLYGGAFGVIDDVGPLADAGRGRRSRARRTHHGPRVGDDARVAGRRVGGRGAGARPVESVPAQRRLLWIGVPDRAVAPGRRDLPDAGRTRSRTVRAMTAGLACLVSCLLSVLPGQASAPSTTGPTDVIRSSNVRMSRILRPGHTITPADREEMARILTEVTDFERVSERVLGPRWNAMPAAERADFTAAFIRLVAANAIAKMGRYRAERFEYPGRDG